MIIVSPSDPASGNSSSERLLAAMQATEHPRGIIIRKGQSLFDAALQHCGSTDRAHDVALLNSLPLNYVAPRDHELLIPQPDRAAVLRLQRDNCEPCTGDLASAAAYTYYGIGFRPLGQLRVAHSRLSPSAIQSLLDRLDGW